MSRSLVMGMLSGFGTENSKLRRGVALTVLLAAAFAGCAGQQVMGGVEPRLQITVRIYNYAGASRGTLLGAEGESSRIFRRAGVEVAWLDCTASHSPEEKHSDCQTPLGAIAVNLRVLPPSMAGRLKPIQDEMGFAVVSARAGRASDAWVFYQYVERIAAYEVASPSQILGYAMAHEIGHLLLGPDHHSDEGIMSAHWGRKSLAEASQGQLLFTRDQARLIRNEIQTRAEMAQENVTGRPAHGEVVAMKDK